MSSLNPGDTLVKIGRVGGVLVLVGILLLFVAALGPYPLAFGVFGAVMCTVGALIWTSQLIASTQFERFETTVGDIVRHGLVQHSELSAAYDGLGLREIHSDCTAFDYGSIISESGRLIVVLNDGRTWASVHRDRLRRRFADSTKETTLILTHPESPMVQVLARKGSKDIEAIRGRIRDTVQLLEEIKNDHTSLEILGHFLFNPQAVVIGDDTAVVTPFFLSRGGRTVPAFKYQDLGKPCYFRDLLEDVERVRMDTKDISSIPRSSVVPEVLRMKPKSS